MLIMKDDLVFYQHTALGFHAVPDLEPKTLEEHLRQSPYVSALLKYLLSKTVSMAQLVIGQLRIVIDLAKKKGADVSGRKKVSQTYDLILRIYLFI